MHISFPAVLQLTTVARARLCPAVLHPLVVNKGPCKISSCRSPSAGRLQVQFYVPYGYNCLRHLKVVTPDYSDTLNEQACQETLARKPRLVHELSPRSRASGGRHPFSPRTFVKRSSWSTVTLQFPAQPSFTTSPTHNFSGKWTFENF